MPFSRLIIIPLILLIQSSLSIKISLEFVKKIQIYKKLTTIKVLERRICCLQNNDIKQQQQ